MGCCCIKPKFNALGPFLLIAHLDFMPFHTSFMPSHTSCPSTPCVPSTFLQFIEARYMMRSQFEWDRFMRFMDRYAESNGLGFEKVAQKSVSIPIDDLDETIYIGSEGQLINGTLTSLTLSKQRIPSMVWLHLV